VPYEVILNQAMFAAISKDTITTFSVDGTALMELGILKIKGDVAFAEGGTCRTLKIAASKEESFLEEVVGDIRGEFEVVAANGVGGSSAAATLLGSGMLITTLVVAAAFNLM
jgi:hypothetical protein